VTAIDYDAIWDAFLERWPVQAVRAMKLDEYTNTDKTSFAYWIEFQTQKLASIGGGNALKAGIYERAGESAPKLKNVGFDDTYVWSSKYGSTAQEAFQTIKARLLRVIEAAQSGDLEAIEKIDVGWNMFKWKVAFFYQDRDNPKILPVFSKKYLFNHYKKIAPGRKLAETTHALMYPTLWEKYQDKGDLYEIGAHVASTQETGGTQYWLVPLHKVMSEVEARALTSHKKVQDEATDELLQLLNQPDISPGDQLALLFNLQILSTCKVTAIEPEFVNWETTSHPNTDYHTVLHKVELADDADRGRIWHETEPSTKIGYYKIAPGENARLWEDWVKGSYVSMDWSEVGDLNSFKSENELIKAFKDDIGSGNLRRLWDFKNIPVGSKVIANRGTTHILGSGTVTGSYTYVSHAGEHKHRLPVRWDDLREKAVKEGGWRKTLINLTEENFLRLTSDSPSPEKVSAARGPQLQPTAVILYGPPGTGKTWSTMTRALHLLYGAAVVETWSEEVRTKHFRAEQDAGRIAFVTFHQAYGYEEFVEGIRPVMDEDSSDEVRYEVHSGVFKRLALRAATAGLNDESEDSVLARTRRFDELWDELLAKIEDGAIELEQSQSGNWYRLTTNAGGNILSERIDRNDDGTIQGRERFQTASKANSQLLWSHREELGPLETWSYQRAVDVFAKVRGGGGGNHYTPLWIVGKLLSELNKAPIQSHVERAPEQDIGAVQSVLDGTNGSDFKFDTKSQQYVLIIDEINRGNISKILGELITLIEPDKRLGAKNELRLPLAYTPQHHFGVPPNLHIIGTMNTADRSIALMDVALRRRFTFEEMLPDVSVIEREFARENVPEPLSKLVSDIFKTINARIRYIYDRDHQIGHAYFLGVRTMEDLRDVIADRVLPLLQEYFYGAWDRVCAVLGCPSEESGLPLRSQSPCVNSDGYVAPIVEAVPTESSEILGYQTDEFRMEADFVIAEPFRRLASGQFAQTPLAPYFLGILNLSADEYRAKAAALKSLDLT
jgi:5-methylcytosine-specific restriction endonuclease McrBC GTP-binding regulatory subunit McrB